MAKPAAQECPWCSQISSIEGNIAIAGVKESNDFNGATRAPLPLTAKRRMPLIPSSHPCRTRPVGGGRSVNPNLGSYGILELFRCNRAVDTPRKPSRHLDLPSGRNMLSSQKNHDNALDLDLKKLKARAFDRAEWAEEVLRRYHAATPNLDGRVAQQLRALYNWMFVPPTLWPFNVQDVLEDCLAALEKGKRLNSRHRLLIDCCLNHRTKPSALPWPTTNSTFRKAPTKTWSRAGEIRAERTRDQHRSRTSPPMDAHRSDLQCPSPPRP